MKKDLTRMPEPYKLGREGGFKLAKAIAKQIKEDQRDRYFGRCGKCLNCMTISWHVKDEGWKLLPHRWWKEILCLECFFYLVSKRQRRLVIFQLKDFYDIIIATPRVRGSLTDRRWPFKAGRRLK